MVHGYEAVAPRPSSRAAPSTMARGASAAALLLLGAVLVAVVAPGTGGQRAELSAHLKTENPAVRGSDPIENNPASAFIGGPVSMVEFPPQCARITSGDSQCHGPAFDCAMCMDGNGFCRPSKGPGKGPGTIHLEKVDGVGKFKDFFFLTATSSLGHPMMAALRSTDGYSREWNQVGTIWTDKIHKPQAEGRDSSAVTLFQVTDTISGDNYFFRFPCVAPELEMKQTKATQQLHPELNHNKKLKTAPAVTAVPVKEGK